jgi:hypothetical protein
MTARTSQILVDALREAGFEQLAKRAELDEFHDYLSPHDLPDLMLDMELLAIIKSAMSEGARQKAIAIRERHHRGEFDADLKESDEWAASEDGQETFKMLINNGS